MRPAHPWRAEAYRYGPWDETGRIDLRDEMRAGRALGRAGLKTCSYEFAQRGSVAAANRRSHRPAALEG